MTDIEKNVPEAELKDKELDEVAGGSFGEKAYETLFSEEEYKSVGITLKSKGSYGYLYIYQGQSISMREANRLVEEKAASQKWGF